MYQVELSGTLFTAIMGHVLFIVHSVSDVDVGAGVQPPPRSSPSSLCRRQRRMRLLAFPPHNAPRITGEGLQGTTIKVSTYLGAE